MKDGFGREINYLRLSLTDRCNFRCRYCMPPDGVIMLRHADMLTLEELFAVVKLMAERMGFNKVRVTGGEPLIRKGAIEFMQWLGTIDAVDDLSLTTNAFHLEPHARVLHDAGFRRVNISLDTLRRDLFEEITRVDGLPQVLRGIRAAKEVGFDPIKLNAVAIRENLDEVVDLVDFGVQNGIQVRFIELMPVLGGSNGEFVSVDRVRQAIETRYKLLPIGEGGDPRGKNPSSAAEVFRIEGTEATCGFIPSITRPFCRACNRVRLRGDGHLKPCLASSQSFDLMPHIRPAFASDALEAFIRERIVSHKRLSRGAYEIDSMSMYGG
jgi:cyclic pyranopterin phosphate synthase